MEQGEMIDLTANNYAPEENKRPAPISREEYTTVQGVDQTQGCRQENSQRANSIIPDAPGQRSNEPESITWADSMKLAFGLWKQTILKSTYILIPVMLFMWLFYMPVIVLPREVLDDIVPILYDRIRGYISMVTFYATISLVSVHIFSFDFAKKAILRTTVPCCLVDFMFRTIPQRKSFWASMGVNIMGLSAGCLSIYTIKVSEPLENMTADQAKFYQLTKDGTPMSLLKGLIGVFIILNFSVGYFLPYLFSFSFFTQLIFRLFFFPIISYLIKMFQTFVLFGLSLEEMDRRLLVNRVSACYIKYIGRIVMSNLSTGSSPGQYVALNLLLSIVDAITTISFKQRTVFLFKIRIWVLSLYKGKRRNKRIVSIVPGHGGGLNGLDSHMETDLDKYLKKSIQFRSLNMFHELAYEIIVVFIAPFLMYFLGPIYPNSAFNTIKSITECLFQIFIQLVFVFIGDILSLTYEIRSKTVVFEADTNIIHIQNKTISCLISIFCVVYTQYLVSIS